MAHALGFGSTFLLIALGVAVLGQVVLRRVVHDTHRSVAPSIA